MWKIDVCMHLKTHRRRGEIGSHSWVNFSWVTFEIICIYKSCWKWSFYDSFATALDRTSHLCEKIDVCMAQFDLGQTRRAGAAVKSGQFVGQFSWVIPQRVKFSHIWNLCSILKSSHLKSLHLESSHSNFSHLKSLLEMFTFEILSFDILTEITTYIWNHLKSSHFESLNLKCSHLKSSLLKSMHLKSSHLTSSHLTSSHLKSKTHVGGLT